MPSFLKQPKVRVSGGKITIFAFEIFHAGEKRSIDESDVEFGPEQASHWFYIQVVRFKSTNDYGYHVSEGIPGTGPATSQDTGEIEFVATVASGNVKQDGSAIADYHQHVIPSSLLEVK